MPAWSRAICLASASVMRPETSVGCGVLMETLSPAVGRGCASSAVCEETTEGGLGVGRRVGVGRGDGLGHLGGVRRRGARGEQGGREAEGSDEKGEILFHIL